MEARHNLGRIRKLVTEGVRHDGRLQRTCSNTVDAVDFRCLYHQSGQRITADILTVGCRLNACQNDLAATVLGNGSHLCQNVLGRTGNDISSRLFDNTIGAVVVASILDLDIATVAVRLIHRHRFQCRGFHVQNSAILFFLARTNELRRKFRNGELIAVSANIVYAGNRRNLFCLDLRKTSHHQNKGIGICYRRAADHLTGFAFGFRRYRTGIDNIYVTNVRK